jgi:uncharacterized protein (DUF486 family)
MQLNSSQYKSFQDVFSLTVTLSFQLMYLVKNIPEILMEEYCLN